MVFSNRAKGRGRGRGVGEVAFVPRSGHGENEVESHGYEHERETARGQAPDELRITVGNDKFRDRHEPVERQAMHREAMHREEEQYRRETDLYGSRGERESYRDYRHSSSSYDRDPYRRPEEREYGDRRGLGAEHGHMPPREALPPPPPQRTEHLFPAASASPAHSVGSAEYGGASRPLKSILKKKNEPTPAESAPPKVSGLPGMANYIDDIEDEDRFLYGDDERKETSPRQASRGAPPSASSNILSAAHNWQPSAPQRPVEGPMYGSSRRQYADSSQYSHHPNPQAQVPAASEASGDLWSMLAKSVQAVQQQQQVAPTTFGAPQNQQYGMQVQQEQVQPPVQPMAQAQAPSHDPTIENILKSIGFDFEMSKRMQEKAKHASGEVPLKEPKPADPEYGINENASFIGSGMSHEDMRSQLKPDAADHKRRDGKQGGGKQLERGCSPVSDEGSPPPPMFNLPPITIKRRSNVERRSPDWDKRVERRSSRSPDKDRGRSPSWTQSVSSHPSRRSQSPARYRSSQSKSPERRIYVSEKRSPSPVRRQSTTKPQSPSPVGRAQSPVITRTINLDGLLHFKRRHSRSPDRKSRSPRPRSPVARIRSRTRSPVGRRHSRSRSPRTRHRSSRSPRGNRRRSRSTSRGRKRGYSRSQSRSRERKYRRSSSRDRYRRPSHGDHFPRSGSRERFHRRRGLSGSPVSSDSDPDGPANKEYFSAPLKLNRDNYVKQGYERSPQVHPPEGPPPFSVPPPTGPPPGMFMGQGFPPGVNPSMPPPGFPYSMPGPPPGYPGFMPPPVSYAMPPPPMCAPMPMMSQPPPDLAPPGTLPLEMPLAIPARHSAAENRMGSPIPIERSFRKRSRSRSGSWGRDKARRRSRSKSLDRGRGTRRSRSRSQDRSKERRKSRSKSLDRSRERKRSRSRSRDNNLDKKADKPNERTRMTSNHSETPLKVKAEDRKIGESQKESNADLTSKDDAKKVSDGSQSEKEKTKVLKEKENYDSEIKALEMEYENLKKQEVALKKKQGNSSKPDPILVENNKLLNEIKKELGKLKSKRQDLVSKYGKILPPEPVVKREIKITPKATDGAKKPMPKKVKEEFKVEKGKLMKHYFVDNGDHWCRNCKVLCLNLHDFVQHVSSPKHKKTLIPDYRPWKDGFQHSDGMIVNKAGIQVPVPGVEFLLPVSSFYCQICKILLADVSCAVDHFRCESHYLNYKKYCKDNPFYEQKYKEEKAAFLAGKNLTPEEMKELEETKKVQAEQFKKRQIQKNKEADSRVRENEKKWEKSVEDLDDVKEETSPTNISKGQIKLSLKNQKSVEEEQETSAEVPEEDNSRSAGTEVKVESTTEEKTNDKKTEDGQDKSKINFNVTLTGKNIIGKSIAPKKNPLLPPWQPVSKKLEQVTKPHEPASGLDSFLTCASGDGKIPVVAEKKKLSAKDVLKAFSERKEEEQAAKERRELEKKLEEEEKRKQKQKEFEDMVAAAQLAQKAKELIEKAKADEEKKMMGIDPDSEEPLAEIKPPPPPSQNVPHPEQKTPASLTASDVQKVYLSDQNSAAVLIDIDLDSIPIPPPVPPVPSPPPLPKEDDDIDQVVFDASVSEPLADTQISISEKENVVKKAEEEDEDTVDGFISVINTDADGKIEACAASEVSPPEDKNMESITVEGELKDSVLLNEDSNAEQSEDIQMVEMTDSANEKDCNVNDFVEVSGNEENGINHAAALELSNENKMISEVTKLSKNNENIHTGTTENSQNLPNISENGETRVNGADKTVSETADQTAQQSMDQQMAMELGLPCTADDMNMSVDMGTELEYLKEENIPTIQDMGESSLDTFFMVGDVPLPEQISENSTENETTKQESVVPSNNLSEVATELSQNDTTKKKSSAANTESIVEPMNKEEPAEEPADVEEEVEEVEIKTKKQTAKRGRGRGRGKGRGRGRGAKVKATVGRSTRSAVKAAEADAEDIDSDIEVINLKTDVESAKSNDTVDTNKESEKTSSVEVDVELDTPSKKSVHSPRKSSPRARKISHCETADTENAEDNGGASDSSSVHMGSDFEVVDELDDQEMS